MQRIRLFLAASAALTLLPAPAPAQELVHHAQGIEQRLSQLVKLIDPWEDGIGDGIFEAVPRDVETRIVLHGPEDDRVEVQLLLHGPWDWFHFAYAESEILRAPPRATGKRTLRFAADVDEDDQNEMLLLERIVVTELLLDENGDPIGGAEPRYAEHRIRLRYLDREGDALVETLMTGDPDSPGFARLLATELGGAANAALQLFAGDYLFSQERYADAQYRYRVAREWAERSLSARRLAELSTTMTLLEPDPDHAEFTWITAHLRHGALPPYYRKRF
jgi:hypothetical protein